MMGSKAREIQKKLTVQIGELYFNNQLRLWEIADIVKIAERNVWEHVQKYRAQLKKELESEDVAERVLVENLSNKNKIIRNAWLEAAKAEDGKTRATYYKLIDDTQNNKIDLLQKMKIIEKNPEKIDVNITTPHDLITLAKNKTWKTQQPPKQA